MNLDNSKSENNMCKIFVIAHSLTKETDLKSTGTSVKRVGGVVLPAGGRCCMTLDRSSQNQSLCSPTLGGRPKPSSFVAFDLDRQTHHWYDYRLSYWDP